MGLLDGLLGQPGVTATGGGTGYDPRDDEMEVRFTAEGTPYNARPGTPLHEGHTRANQPMFNLPNVEVPTEPSLLNYGYDQTVQPPQQVDVNPTQEYQDINLPIKDVVNPIDLYNRQGRADYIPQNIVSNQVVEGNPSLGYYPNMAERANAEEQWYNNEQAKQDASAMEALNKASAERDKQAQIEAQLQALLKAQGLDNRAEWDMRRANDQFTNLDKQYDINNQVATDDFGNELFNANEHGQTSYDINAIKRENLDNLMMQDREPVVTPPVVAPTDNKPNYPSHLTPYAIKMLEEQRKRNEMFQGIGDTAVDMYEGAKTLGSDAIQGAQDLYQDFTKPDVVVEPTPTSADDLNLFDILGETDELVKKDDKKPDLSHLTPWAREQIESQNARNEFFQGVGDTASDIVKGTVGGPAINWYNNLSKDAEGEKQKYSGNEDIGGLMRQNFGQNFAEIVKGGVDAAISPIETADAIASLVSGAVQHTLPDDMAWNDESKKMASAVADIYAERYGSLEGFKKALAENPAEVLLELTGAGLITKAGVVKLTQKIKGNPDFIRDLNLGETIDKGVTKFLPGMKKEIFSGANSGRPWKMTSKGDGDFYIQRVGPNAGKVSKTRNGPSDIAFSVDQDVLLPDYAYYAVMSIEKKLQARAHGTAQQAINHKDVDAVLTDLFQNMNKSESKVDDGVLGQTPVKGFHGTKEEYVDYGFGKNNTDPGWHFGSNKSSAKSRLEAIDVEENINPYTNERARQLPENPVDSPKGHKIIANDLGIKKPLRVHELEDMDSGVWNAKTITSNVLERGELPDGFTQLDKKAWKDGTLSAKITQGGKQVDVQLKDVDSLDIEKHTEWIDNFLNDRGYDGLVYDNAFEGGGDSYAIYNKSKIKQTDVERYATVAIPTGGLLAGGEESQAEEIKPPLYTGPKKPMNGVLDGVKETKSWQPQNNLLDFVKNFENAPLAQSKSGTSKAYKDYDTTSQGFGSEPKKDGSPMTKAEANKAVIKQLIKANKAVDRLVKIDLNEDQRNTLVSMLSNIKTDKFAKSNALKALNNGNIKTFLKEAFDPKIGFVKAGGKVVNGLVRRRAREKQIFTKGNYGN